MSNVRVGCMEFGPGFLWKKSWSVAVSCLIVLALGLSGQTLFAYPAHHGIQSPAVQQETTDQHPIPNVIFVNGNILTLDDSSNVVQAVAVQDGKVLATGDDAEIRKLADQSTRVIDLGGKTVMPGMIDTHTHASLLMKVRNEYVDVHFST